MRSLNTELAIAELSPNTTLSAALYEMFSITLTEPFGAIDLAEAKRGGGVKDDSVRSVTEGRRTRARL